MNDPELLPLSFQLIAELLLLLLLGWVLYLIRWQRVGLRESLLWLVSTLVALVFTSFPMLLQKLAALAGVRVPSNALFAMAFIYVIVNLLAITIGLSSALSRTRRLSQECAILRAEIDQLRAPSMLTRSGDDAP